MPKVSVIVPIYNVEQYINQCIDSLIRQTLKNIEIILIDDGSPDNCGKICDEYAKKDNRIIVIHKKNEGVSAARNDGIDIAKGDFFMFVDADDWCDEKMCEIAYNKVIKKNAEIAFFTHYINYPKKEVRTKKAPNIFLFNKMKDIEKVQLTVMSAKYIKLIDKKSSYGGFTAPWSKIFSKKLIKNNNIKFNLNVGGIFDDGLFVLECLQHTKNIYFENIFLYHYRIINFSITNSYNPNKLKKYEKIFDEIEKFIKKYNKSSEFLNAYYCRIMVYLSGSIDMCFFNKLNKESYFNTAKKLKKTLNKERYKMAIKNVKMRFLTKKQKLYLILFKLNNVFFIYLVSKLINIAKKLSIVNNLHVNKR